jgi:hypothetical protein
MRPMLGDLKLEHSGGELVVKKRGTIYYIGNLRETLERKKIGYNVAAVAVVSVYTY